MIERTKSCIANITQLNMLSGAVNVVCQSFPSNEQTEQKKNILLTSAQKKIMIYYSLKIQCLKVLFSFKNRMVISC